MFLFTEKSVLEPFSFSNYPKFMLIKYLYDFSGVLSIWNLLAVLVHCVLGAGQTADL